MKKVFLTIFVIVSCLLLVGCGKTTQKEVKKETKEKKEYTRKTNIEISDNAIIVPSNGGTPFMWKYKIEDPFTVDFDHKEVVDPHKDEQLAGGVYYTHYYFEASRTGKTTVTFICKDVSKDYKTVEERTFILEADKNLDVTIKEAK